MAAPAFPDLTIQNALAPLSSTKGKLETVSFDVLNQGTAVAPLSKFRLLLSTDAVPDATDIVLLQSDINPLGIGAKTGINAPIQIPTNIAAGNYYLLYQIDYTNAIAESNESNNLVTRTIAIQDVSCGATQAISVGGMTTTTVNVVWNAVAGAVSYRVDYKMTSATTWTAGPTAATNAATLTGLQPNTSYEVRTVTNCAYNAQSTPSLSTPFRYACDSLS